MIEALEKNNQLPSVTILLASYNRLELLKLAVDSALDQQYKNFNIIIVDDGSDTDVIEWLQQLESSVTEVSVYYQKHKGVAAARALGVEKSQSEFVCILDSDDTLVSDALDKLVTTVVNKAEIKMVHCNIHEIRSNGTVLIQRYRNFSCAQEMLMTTLIKPRLPFKHTGTLFHRLTAVQLGSYDVNLPCKVDIDLYLKFLRAGYLPALVDEPLVNFKMHKNSVSINRLLGIKVWMLLIDKYGPANSVYRLYIKIIRISAELLKRLYVELMV